MKLAFDRDHILKPLLKIIGVVERRQSLPILSNLLFQVSGTHVSLTGTDLEIELVAHIELADSDETGEFTLPARKFVDICRALPEGAQIKLQVESEKVRIQSGRSRFVLSTLPANEFPTADKIESPTEFSVEQGKIKHLIERTQFAMAQQDVRYYLNGLMLEIDKNELKAVATDGHRLALSSLTTDLSVDEVRQVILPRKGVGELAKLLEDTGAEVKFSLGTNHLRASLNDVVFTTKLIDGKFPDYRRVIPENGQISIQCDRESLKQAFSRASVLSNEKYRGMRMHLSNNLLKATVHNPEQEEAEEELEVSYSGDDFEIGFNVAYFLDVLNVLDSDEVSINLTDANSSCLVMGKGDEESRYVIMPMRL